MKTPIFFVILLFFSTQLQAQISNYYLYSFPNQELFEPNEEIPFVTFSMGQENGYDFIETKVCQYIKVRIDYCLCWDPEFHITELLEESGEPCEIPENQLFEQEYFNSFAVDNIWYYWDQDLEGEEHHFHLTGSMVPGQPYLTYTNLLMETIEQNISSKIKIFPIPSKNEINFSEQIKEVVVFDLKGKIVLQSKSLSDKLDITILPEGNYIVKGYVYNGQFFQGKFLKK